MTNIYHIVSDAPLMLQTRLRAHNAYQAMSFLNNNASNDLFKTRTAWFLLILILTGVTNVVLTIIVFTL